MDSNLNNKESITRNTITASIIADEHSSLSKHINVRVVGFDESVSNENNQINSNNKKVASTGVQYDNLILNKNSYNLKSEIKPFSMIEELMKTDLNQNNSNYSVNKIEQHRSISHLKNNSRDNFDNFNKYGKSTNSANQFNLIKDANILSFFDNNKKISDNKILLLLKNLGADSCSKENAYRILSEKGFISRANKNYLKYYFPTLTKSAVFEKKNKIEKTLNRNPNETNKFPTILDENKKKEIENIKLINKLSKVNIDFKLDKSEKDLKNKNSNNLLNNSYIAECFKNPSLSNEKSNTENKIKQAQAKSLSKNPSTYSIANKTSNNNKDNKIEKLIQSRDKRLIFNPSESKYYFSDNYVIEDNIVPEDMLSLNLSLKSKEIRLGIIKSSDVNISLGEKSKTNHLNKFRKPPLNRLDKLGKGLENSRALKINHFNIVNQQTTKHTYSPGKNYSVIKHNLYKLGFPKTRLNSILNGSKKGIQAYI